MKHLIGLMVISILLTGCEQDENCGLGGCTEYANIISPVDSSHYNMGDTVFFEALWTETDHCGDNAKTISAGAINQEIRVGNGWGHWYLNDTVPGDCECNYWVVPFDTTMDVHAYLGNECDHYQYHDMVLHLN
jgi:hypothetical protein